MKKSEFLFLPLFERFILDTIKGRRLKPNGAKVKPQTVRSYSYIIQYLKEFEVKKGRSVRIKVLTGNNERIFLAEKKYWKTFYQEFTDHLYTEKKCHDNYVGTIIKIIRIFFNYLNKDLGIKTGDFYKHFYICREEIPIITLLPAQLNFLINDKEFDDKLNPSLKKTKDIFVFGCTVALRVSDLFSIQFKDVEQYDLISYLPVKTIKTGTNVRIKLPGYAKEIISNFKVGAKKRKQIFPPIPLTRFNLQIKELCELAGWTNEIGKFRNKRGRAIEDSPSIERGRYRFCDQVSSHVMRRTAITTMLMMGMKEHIVKQVSGHTKDSSSFYRYVNLAQSYMDNEMDMVFNKLALKV